MFPLESSLKRLTSLSFIFCSSSSPKPVVLYWSNPTSQGHLVISGDVRCYNNPISIFWVEARDGLSILQCTGQSLQQRIIQPQISILLRLTSPVQNPGNLTIVLMSPGSTARFLNVCMCVCVRTCVRLFVLISELKVVGGQNGSEEREG